MSVHTGNNNPADTGAEAGQAAEGAGPDLHLPADALGLEIVRLLAEGPAGETAPYGDALADVPAYDGHVALALDLEVLPEIDSTLDLLTSSHQLFDVPAVDAASLLDDSMPT